MNKKGFTLIELLAVIIILGTILSISFTVVNYGYKEAKKETEEVFIKTLRDAISVYMNSGGKKLNFSSTSSCQVDKMLGTVKVYEGKNGSAVITFKDVINSEYHPIAEQDIVNPANEKVNCNLDAKIRIYRDEDYVYYYKFSGSELNCLVTNTGTISNFPEGSGC